MSSLQAEFKKFERDLKSLRLEIEMVGTMRWD